MYADAVALSYRAQASQSHVKAYFFSLRTRTSNSSVTLSPCRKGRNFAERSGSRMSRSCVWHRQLRREVVGAQAAFAFGFAAATASFVNALSVAPSSCSVASSRETASFSPSWVAQVFKVPYCAIS